MKEEYKTQLEKIKAPRELIERTKLEMRKELAKKESTVPLEMKAESHQVPSDQVKEEQPRKSQTIIKFNFQKTVILSAAVILIALGGFSYYQSQTKIEIQAVTTNMLTLKPNFGKANENKNPEKQDFKVISSPNADIIPEFLKTVTASKIKGHQVQLGLDKDGVYHGAYELDGLSYYVTAQDVSEAEFIDFLKNKF